MLPRYTTSATLLAAAALVTLSAADGNFGGSCSNFRLDNGHYFTANCGDGAGGYRDSTEDLNLCIANYWGNLASADGGNYAYSCYFCNIQGSSLWCDCDNGNDGQKVTQIDLNGPLANYGGYLWCSGHRGT